MKDIIINLQMALLTNLRVSLLNDEELHYGELQIASDDSRVQSVVALCQLYQRLSQAKAIPAVLRTVSRTPPHGVEYPALLSSSPPDLRTSRVVSDDSSSLVSRPPSSVFDRSEASSPASPDSQRTPIRNSLPNSKRSLFQSLRQNSQRHRASSDVTGGVSEQENEPALRPRALVIQTSNASRRRSPQREYYSPDEVNPWTVAETEDDNTQAPAPGPSTDAEVYDPDGWASAMSTRGSNRSTSSSHSSSVVEVNPYVPPITPMGLYLPSEQNQYAGFCKGAWKQQLGLKKAFVIGMRPAGLYNEIPYWKCSKCAYEGPVRGHEARKTWKFDGQVRSDPATGIRYRWLFLAKSHVPGKRLQLLQLQQSGNISAQDASSSGPFGCIFCCAMRHGPAPVFGNLQSFMEHLRQQHSTIRPGFEALLERTRCVLGRVAAASEDFDLNIP